MTAKVGCLGSTASKKCSGMLLEMPPSENQLRVAFKVNGSAAGIPAGR